MFRFVPRTVLESDLILKYFHFIPKLKILALLCDETTKNAVWFHDHVLHVHVRLLIHASLICGYQISSFELINKFLSSWGRDYSSVVKGS